MRLIKLAVLSVVFLFLLLWLMSLFIPSQIRISRAVNVNAPAGTVQPLLEDLRLWRGWNLMVQDSVLGEAKISEVEIMSERAEIKLVSSSPGLVTTNWKRDGRLVASNFQLINSGSDVTIVQWYFDIRLRWYPWEKFSSIVFDRQMGPAMERSLENLRDQAEKGARKTVF